jgi:RimJ/RimL family protein N-acetyltransferase
MDELGTRPVIERTDGGNSRPKRKEKDAIEGWKNRNHFKFDIIFDNKMVGGIDLNKPDFKHHTIQCDYAIHSSYWGNGIVTEAIRLA